MTKKISILLTAVLLMATAMSVQVRAATFPSITLSSNGSSVQAIISNADANAPVVFHYPSGGADLSANIGTTDTNGYLTVQINPASYNLSLGVPVYVVVNQGHSATATWPAVSGPSSGMTLYLTQTSVSVTPSQSVSITASNVDGTLSIPGNTNPSAASAAISGNTITVTGISNGTAAITVCATGSGCSTVNVTVQPSYIMSPALYLNPTNPNVNVGQSVNIAITGYAGGPYYVSTNSSPNTVSTVVNSSNLIVTGLSAGGANISVCATGGQCNTLYVTVTGTSGSATAAPVASNVAPILSSMNIATNGSNPSYVGTGNSFIFSFSANQPIVNVGVSVNGLAISANGTGAGPYTANYTVTGQEVLPIPVVITFANSSGLTGRSFFAVGNTPVTAIPNPPVVSAPTPAPTPAAVPSAPSGYSFNRYLYAGMMSLGETDPDVSALQQRLKADGLYSGPVTGYFGIQSKSAVEAYQKKHGLTVIGVVGPSTRVLLNQGI